MKHTFALKLATYACTLSVLAAQNETITVSKTANYIPQKDFTAQTKPLGVNLVKIPGNNKEINDFHLSECEISNEQYVTFLNEAFQLGQICYVPKYQKVFDREGNQMIWLGGSRVVKDHNRDGKYTLDEMENPLNRCFIDFDLKTQRFFVVDPQEVDWSQYFDPKLYPNVVDSLENWAELNPKKKGWYGEGDKDKKLPTLAEVKTWPVNFVRYYGARAFAQFYGYDLPTKAQWQYAGKGGKSFEHATSDGTGDRGVSWINVDGPFELHRGHVQPVKSKKPNPYGLYNMGGNVWEWCEDWWKGTQVFFSEKKDADFFIDESITFEEANGKYLKCLLGGSFNFFPRTMRVDWNHAAKANVGNDHFGFRVAYNSNSSEQSLRALTIQKYDNNGDSKLGKAEQQKLAIDAKNHFATLQSKIDREGIQRSGNRIPTGSNTDGKPHSNSEAPNYPTAPIPGQRGPQGGDNSRRAEMIKKFDKDGDGKLSLEERQELRK